MISQRGERRERYIRVLSFHSPALFLPLISKSGLTFLLQSHSGVTPILPSEAQNSSFQKKAPHATLFTHNHIPSPTSPSSSVIVTKEGIPPLHFFPSHHLLFPILFSSPVSERVTVCYYFESHFPIETYNDVVLTRIIIFSTRMSKKVKRKLKIPDGRKWLRNKTIQATRGENLRT